MSCGFWEASWILVVSFVAWLWLMGPRSSLICLGFVPVGERVAPRFHLDFSYLCLTFLLVVSYVCLISVLVLYYLLCTF